MLGLSADIRLNRGHPVFLAGSEQGEHLVIRAWYFGSDGIKQRDEAIHQASVLRKMKNGKAVFKFAIIWLRREQAFENWRREGKQCLVYTEVDFVRGPDYNICIGYVQTQWREWRIRVFGG